MKTLEDILDEYFRHDGQGFNTKSEGMNIKYSVLSALITDLYTLTECFSESELLETLDHFAEAEGFLSEEEELEAML